MNLVVSDEPLRTRNGRRLQHVDGHPLQRSPPRLIPLRISPVYHDDLLQVLGQLDAGNFTEVRTYCKPRANDRHFRHDYTVISANNAAWSEIASFPPANRCPLSSVT